ncbi:hypothetical protein P280DRAFT_533788 [Massarina eburnea CBS 473.64]|uniref:BZIP domain-containing protein n=1 Tax=Massarina eburnea CBS 473.64 TaxID=1395130 RepID=A0A6A6RNY5_9PLEO|nr:hypothetical protein P280DRAFT_533788 [Massarina eburnea CBS 473.64]
MGAWQRPIEHIEVKRKTQLKEARAAEDDWTGKTSAKERRKAQNRLHQRAWRRRKLDAQAQSATSFLPPSPSPASLTIPPGPSDDAISSAFAAATASFFPNDIPSLPVQAPVPAPRPYGLPPIPAPSPSNPSSKSKTHTIRLRRTRSIDINAVRPSSTITPSNLHALMSANLESWASSDGSRIESLFMTRGTGRGIGTRIFTPQAPPRPNYKKPIPPLMPSEPVPASSLKLIFPLCPDAHLITLIQYNVMRALMINFHLCNLLTTIPSSCHNLLFLPLPHNPPSNPPPSFAPTRIQKLVMHRDWIDTFPCPITRDNLILGAPSSGESDMQTLGIPGVAEGERMVFDEDEMCSDTCGGLYEGFDDCATRGLLVWGDPWLVRNWEIGDEM